MKNRILLLLLLMSVSVIGQLKREAFTMVKGNSLAIFLVNPLSANESYNVYRKTDAGFILLTQNPITPILDQVEARVILDPDWDVLSKAVDSDNEVQVSRQIRSNTFKGAVLSLISNRAAVVAGRWFVDAKIKKGKSYTYKLVFKEFDKVTDSLIVTARANSVIPKAPSNLELTTGNKVIKLKWNYPKWKGDYSDIGFTYSVYRKEGAGEFKRINKNIIIRDDATEPGYDDLWLKEGVKYYYKVTIVDPIGNESEATNVASVLLEDKTPPTIVTNVLAQETKDGINITWSMSTQLDVKGYYIYRSRSLTGTFVKLNKTPINFESPFFKDTTISVKVQYFYAITAVDTAGNEGEQSNPISTYLRDDFPPDAPSELSYKIIDSQVQLSWKPSKAKDVQGYHIYKSSRAIGMKSRITLTPFVGNTYIDKGENNKGFGYGGKFYYLISAQDSSGNESDSLKLTVFVPDVEAPLPPSDFNLDNKGDYVFVTCGMSPSLDADKYILSKGLLGKEDSIIAKFDKAPFSFVDTISTKGNSYFYSVSVIDTAGLISKETAKDTIMFSDFSPPPAPRNVRARLKEGKVLLTWVESIDYDMMGYNVYRSNLPTGDYKLLNKHLLTETSYTDEGGSKDYFYRVRAVDSSENESKYDETVPVK